MQLSSCARCCGQCYIVCPRLNSDDQPGTFKCARKRCNTCPFIHNADKITGPKRSIKITDRFTCTSANVIYCITCTLYKKIYIGETGRRLGDRFREHLRDVERNDKDASKPVSSKVGSLGVLCLVLMLLGVARVVAKEVKNRRP